MLNKNNERELAYLVIVENITPMNADRLECAHIGGWHCVVGKGEFQVGDPAVYFEIDSQVPEVEPFASMEFLRSKHFKIKTQKIRGEYSQGLLMPISAFGWSRNERGFVVANGEELRLGEESRFVTKRLGVTYAVTEDNRRKASGPDKYKKMAARHPNIFKKGWAKWLMRRNWGRKLMFFFFGKKKDKRAAWPEWVVKTDEERCQNMPYLFPNDDRTWIATEKIDGTSTTFTVKGFGKKRVFLVCSRNVVFDTPEKADNCFYKDTIGNVYVEMAVKYDAQNVMGAVLDMLHEDDNTVEFLTVQGETYGAGVQKRDYTMKDHDIRVFNIIIGHKDGTTKRLNPVEGFDFATKFLHMPYVPVVDVEFKLPDTCEELVAMATGTSMVDGQMREGLVFRSLDGKSSFKAVSNEYLIKYHAG